MEYETCRPDRKIPVQRGRIYSPSFTPTYCRTGRRGWREAQLLRAGFGNFHHTRIALFHIRGGVRDRRFSADGILDVRGGILLVQDSAITIFNQTSVILVVFRPYKTRQHASKLEQNVNALPTVTYANKDPAPGFPSDSAEHTLNRTR